MTSTLNAELSAFCEFLHRQVERGSSLSPEQSLETFRAYQSELQRLRHELAPAIERCGRGEGSELDFDQLEREIVLKLTQS